MPRRIYKIIPIVLILSACAHNPRPWTKTEKALLVGSFTASIADAKTTMDMLENPRIHEVNPILGERPSDQKIVIYFCTTQTLSIILAHYWDRGRPWILGGKTLVNGGLAIHNYRLIQEKREK